MASTTIKPKQNLSARKEGKETKKLPAGATVIDKDVTVTVKEIENGYIICKRVEYKFSTKERGTDWLSLTKEWYSAEDPLEIKIADSNQELADAFEDD